MPKRNDLDSILLIGAGPIVIGQACEFDYSGVQACKALREEGYRVILVNSNPATIMTDPETADSTYIEPINWKTLEKIIEKEKPSALLPTMGGQTALNTALDLDQKGILKKHNVELIGATKEAIDKAEDRELFAKAIKKIGLKTPKAGLAHNLEEALKIQQEIGFPCILRPNFTLGGMGGGIAYNSEEFESICLRGLDLSPTSELYIDQYLSGWKEYEMEVVRDKVDNCIIICSIENFDPMGVHTGDSITVAPAQTLTDKEYQEMRNFHQRQASRLRKCIASGKTECNDYYSPELEGDNRIKPKLITTPTGKRDPYVELSLEAYNNLTDEQKWKYHVGMKPYGKDVAFHSRMAHRIKNSKGRRPSKNLPTFPSPKHGGESIRGKEYTKEEYLSMDKKGKSDYHSIMSGRFRKEGNADLYNFHSRMYHRIKRNYRKPTYYSPEHEQEESQ